MWWGANMITLAADPFNTLLDLQRALESRTASDWLSEHTTSATGPFPPINVFQQGDAILAIIELPGIDKNDLHVQATENTIRISGRKVVAYPEASVHRRERVSGDFDRTLSNSTPTAFRRNTATVCWPCRYREPSGIAHGPFKSPDQQIARRNAP
jgi:HSP20 family protein